MRTKHTLLIALVLASQALAQTAPSPLETLFNRLDRNGDGKITREESGNAPWFDALDRNRDGVVTLEETKAAAAVGASRSKRGEAVGGIRDEVDNVVPDAPLVGEVNGSCIDPEFSEAARQVVFQDVKNNVWIGDIDLQTGLFKTATGRDYLMDEDITLIFDRPPQGRKFSTNGPEWTRDEKGHCVVCTKADQDGVMRQWMARLVNGKSVVTQLTHNTLDRYGNMTSRFQDGKAPRIAYTCDWPIWKAKAARIFADKLNQPRPREGFDYRQMSMWSAVSPDFLFVKRSSRVPCGQIARSNAELAFI